MIRFHPCFYYLLSTILLSASCMVPPAYVQPANPAPGQSPVMPAGQEVTLAGGEGKSVLAEGAAALPSQGGADIARDHALKDALRKAVEQGVGTFVSSESKVQNFQLISDRIYSQASGYVSSYKVIAEGLEGALYRVTVRARVKLDRIEDDLSAIGILVNQQGRPRIMVVVKEVANWGSVDVDGNMLSQEMIETMLIDAFQSKGFPVVDAATVERNLQKEQLKEILAGNNQAAVELGLKSGAEITVAGTAQPSSEKKTSPYGGGPTDFYKYRLSVRAVNVQTAEVLGVSALTRELPFSADQAQRQAADSAGAELVSKVLRGWKKQENITQLFCDNASYAKVQQLKSEITAKVRGVTSVVSRDLTGSTATLEVISEASSQEVLDDLGTRKLNVGFEIKSFAGNRIELRFTDAEQPSPGTEKPGR